MVATRESCREGESSWKSGALNFFQPLFPFFLEKWISYKTLTFFSLVFLFGNCDWRKTWCWHNGKSQMKNISNATYKIPALWLHTKIWMFLNKNIFFSSNDNGILRRKKDKSKEKMMYVVRRSAVMNRQTYKEKIWTSKRLVTLNLYKKNKP